MTSIDLESFIKKNIIKYEKNDDKKILYETINKISQRGYFVDILKSILSDDSYLEEIAKNSYYHANGFIKIVLINSSSPKYKLRLHVWHPRDKDNLDEHIHNHRWDFATKLLIGEYITKIYKKSDKGESYFKYKYLSPNGDSFFTMLKNDVENLDCMMDMNVKEGSSYYISHQQLHKITNIPNKLTVTLLLHGKVRSESTNVYSIVDMKSDEKKSVQYMTKSELEKTLQFILNEYEGDYRED